jgi:hypothetical protein
MDFIHVSDLQTATELTTWPIPTSEDSSVNGAVQVRKIVKAKKKHRDFPEIILPL